MLPPLAYRGNACQEIISLSGASCINDQGISSVDSCTFVPSDWQIVGFSPFSLVLADRIPAGVCLQ